jgi:hypothetical protein
VKTLNVAEVVAGAAPKIPTTLDLSALFEGEVAPLRTFSSGKEGFGFYGKLKIPGGARVQCSVNLVILK